jgi:RNA recognition motif-containing protein
MSFEWVLRSYLVNRKLYVGNLNYGLGNEDLHQLFAAHGTVYSAHVILDRETGRSKGFGFVEMGSDQEAQAAIAALNGKEVSGRSLTVNEARPPQDRGERSGNANPFVTAARRNGGYSDRRN